MQPDERKKWQTTKSEYIVKDRWLKLRAEAASRPPATPSSHIMLWNITIGSRWLCWVTTGR